MSKRTVSKALACLLLFLFLTACGAAGGEEPDWDENILVYANLNPQGVDRAAVSKFNAIHKDIQIEVRDYSDSGKLVGQYGVGLLLTEIMSGQVPDIIDLGSDWGSAGQLPYQQLALKGYLENLWPYIENDPDLGRENLLEAPLKAAEVNGGLYMVFDSVIINTLVGAESIVGDRYSWSLEELMDTLASMPDDSSILPAVCDKYTMFYYMLGMSLNSYVDWETGENSFGSQKFRNILSFINENCPESFDWNISSEEINEEIARKQQDGQQLLDVQLISEPDCVRLLDIRWGGRAAFIGYPVEDGSVGSSFRLSNRKLAISSACRNKTAAWEFVRQTLLPQHSEESYNGYGPSGIPINRIDYEWQKRETGKELETEVFYGGPVVKLPQATEEDYRRFEDFFNSIDKIDMCDRNIYDIVYELCGPYFAGDKTLDETVDLIQRRVSLYVNENQ